MAIKITADSTCDLTGEILTRRNISLAHLGIAKAGELFHDGVDITTADIAAHVEAGGDITTTSAVNIAGYLDLFSEFSPQYDAVIHISLGSGFSSCYQNACLAAEEFDNVRVVDSANLSTGHGLMVLAAADAADEGCTTDEILVRMAELAPKVEASFVLDTLEYMKKGGRCSAVAALGANLLKLHPCIEVVDGRMSVVKKYRGSMERVIADYVRDRLKERDDIDFSRVMLVDTCRMPGLVELARKALEEDGRFAEIIEAPAGCTIFCHCGPDALGIMFCRK